MSTKKLPANAPKIPRGWEYKGEAWASGKSVCYAFWTDGMGWNTWEGLPRGHEGTTLGFADRHYITPIKRPAKKPALAKPKIPAHVLKNARELAEMGRVAREKALAKGKAKGKPVTKAMIDAGVKAYGKERCPSRWDGEPWGQAGIKNHRLGITAAIRASIGVAGGKGAK